MTGLQLKPGTSWWETYARCVAVAPEAFESDRLLNLFDGRWQRVGRPGFHVNPVDGTSIQGPPQVDRDTAAAAVDAAVRQHADWGKVELDERKERVTAAVDMMAAHRDLLALLLVWGDRQAVAAGLRGRRPRAGRRPLVGRGDRPAGRGTQPPTRPGVEHRQLKLPRQRAGARRAGPGAGRQGRRREDAEPGRLPLPDAGARLMARTGLPMTLLSGAGSKLGDVLISSAGIGRSRWPRRSA
jgi:hypothetical protein